MLFLETSAKTGYNIDECFQESCKSISKRINEEFYDLTNEVIFCLLFYFPKNLKIFIIELRYKIWASGKW